MNKKGVKLKEPELVCSGSEKNSNWVRCLRQTETKELQQDRQLDSFSLLVHSQRVVQFGDALLKVVHDQSPVLIEERRHRLGELGVPGLLRLPVPEGDPEGVLIIKPGDKQDQDQNTRKNKQK